jgi:hypothetical protein
MRSNNKTIDGEMIMIEKISHIIENIKRTKR